MCSRISSLHGSTTCTSNIETHQLGGRGPALWQTEWSLCELRVFAVICRNAATECSRDGWLLASRGRVFSRRAVGSITPRRDVSVVRVAYSIHDLCCRRARSREDACHDWWDERIRQA